MINENTNNIKFNRLLNLRKYILYFIMYSMFGWIYEVFLEVVVYKWGFSNRGVLFGPYCPVYGVGALIFLFAIYPIIRNKSFGKRLLWILPVFLGCMTVATLLELITSYIMEWTTGSWPWQTYVDYDIHFQGRIALSPSIRFGLGGVFFLYVIQPLFEKITGRMDSRQLSITSITVLGILMVDFIYTVFFRG
ncbi:Putative ABC-transporter type IV [Dethiosulfatibacter aminovorans DSM 17477]|uniref:Putative ABC-transporter type IV n=1 Tax=Dethiosulfatibacter aminovorans DSM 17477 TaxID=1121476 RepID=A0A1M6AP21_9FIRM|nr:putative ABC transporter permease [Dethiosulfatibacter aminovorans]SHI38259.1 Putative ABC-transporter type IV [Dethiosulfatibacter aminovorans DSM 17477]